MISLKQIKGIEQLTNMSDYTSADLTSLSNRLNVLEHAMNNVTSPVIQDIIDAAPGEITSIDDVASILRYYPYNSAASVVFDQLYNVWTKVVAAGTIEEYEPYKYEFSGAGVQLQNICSTFNTTPIVLDMYLEIEATANIWVFMFYNTVNTSSTTYPYLGLLWNHASHLFSLRRQTANNGSANTWDGTAVGSNDGTTSRYSGHIMYLHDPSRGEFLYEYGNENVRGGYFPWVALKEQLTTTTLNLKHLRINCNKGATAAAYKTLRIPYFRAYSLIENTVTDPTIEEPYTKELLSSWSLTTPETDQDYPYWESTVRLATWQEENGGE